MTSLSLGIIHKVHLGFQIRVWEDPLIPMIPVRPARPSVPVVHPHMTVSEVIHGLPKVCIVEMAENLVVQEDIPLIEILALNQSNRDD